MDGASVTFEDAADGDVGSDFDAKQYAYLGRDTATGWHLVLSVQYESHAWLVIGVETGAITQVDGVPALSQSGRHLLVRVLWPARNVARLEVWAVEKDGPVLEWRHETMDWVPHETAWVAEGRATVTGWRDGTRVHAVVQQGDDGAWKLTEIPEH